MPTIDREKQEILFRFAYHGPALAGKAANLQHIYAETRPENRREIRDTASEDKRILAFDLRPISLGKVGDLDIRVRLLTVAGAILIASTRRDVIDTADGIVFVADSQRARAEANVQSLELLEEILAGRGRRLPDVPFAIQYNKRDLSEIASVAQLDAALNRAGHPRFEAVAREGRGVFDTLRAVVLPAISRAQKA